MRGERPGFEPPPEEQRSPEEQEAERRQIAVQKMHEVFPYLDHDKDKAAFALLQATIMSMRLAAVDRKAPGHNVIPQIRSNVDIAIQALENPEKDWTKE